MIKNNKPATITLAHINDSHSYFEPQSLQLNLNIDGRLIFPYVSNGGFARIATRIKQLKNKAQKNKREFMFVHAGDCFQGTLYFSLFKGKANSDMLNALGIDMMALGNHELDMGNEPVADFLNRIEFPLLVGNWDLSNELTTKSHPINGHPNILSYRPDTRTAQWITRLVDGEPIALFGISLDKMADIATVDVDTPFINAFETADNTVREINRMGINKIILISHLGFDSDCELAKAVNGISLIVGGHTHTLQGDFSEFGLKKEVEYGLNINNTYIVQAGCYAQALGHCEIDFAADGSVTKFAGKNELLLGRRLFSDPNLHTEQNEPIHTLASQFLAQHNNIKICKKDQNIQNVLEDKYIPRVRKLQKSVIAHSTKNLRHVRVPDQQGGSEIAPLVAESFIYMMNKNSHYVDFAIHNSGGVRTSLPAGKVSIADIAGKLLPFLVPIGAYRIKGKYIALALEGAINNATNNGVVGTGDGSYPYTHNLTFNYHPEQPFGERITELKMYREGPGWINVEDNTIYKGSSSAYTMKGKEGYEALTNIEGDGFVSNHSMADCFIEFIQDMPEKLILAKKQAQSGLSDLN